jgi:putative peptidoglycan lipid II flippase
MLERTIPNEALSPSGGLRRLLGPTVVITLFTLAGQGVAFATQVITAAAFGARADMDAFLAANTLPQYVIAVSLNALGYVFIPVFIEYMSAGREQEAWQIAGAMITMCLLVLGGLAVVGVAFAGTLLSLATPGLSANSLQLARQVAIITWPATVATGFTSLLAGIYQAQGRFGWPAAAPVIGALVNLTLVILLVRPLGVIGLAIAATANMSLQAILLAPILIGRTRLRWAFNWRHAGVRKVLNLLWPLILSGVCIRATLIVDRYLASGLGEGTISHLEYAYKLLGLLGTLVSTGLATVLFRRMATNTAQSDLLGMRRTVSGGLRLMWLAVAPVITVGGVLALPVVTILLQRGQFGSDDAKAVAVLLQIYLFALAGMCMGSVIFRGLYALKETRLIALLSTFEAIGYALYTPWLARWWGAPGVALGYVIYFTPGLLWGAWLIRRKTGNRGGRTALSSLGRSGLAALLAGAAAWQVTAASSSVWVQFVLGSVAGLGVYGLALLAFGSPEALQVSSKVLNWLRSRSNTQLEPGEIGPRY